MHKNQVKVGKSYRCTFGRNEVIVKIDCASELGGWDGTILSTGMPIRIKSAERFLGLAAKDKVKTEKTKAAKATKGTGSTTTTGDTKRMSQLDAAARVLAEERRALSCSELFDAMDTQGYWQSPNGRTPERTLYSAMLREINSKGSDARFKKAGKGKFALQT